MIKKPESSEGTKLDVQADVAMMIEDETKIGIREGQTRTLDCTKKFSSFFCESLIFSYTFQNILSYMSIFIRRGS